MGSHPMPKGVVYLILLLIWVFKLIQMAAGFNLAEVIKKQKLWKCIHWETLKLPERNTNLCVKFFSLILGPSKLFDSVGVVSFFHSLCYIEQWLENVSILNRSQLSYNNTKVGSYSDIFIHHDGEHNGWGSQWRRIVRYVVLKRSRTLSISSTC